jgi:putative membrane protein
VARAERLATAGPSGGTSRADRPLERDRGRTTVGAGIVCDSDLLLKEVRALKGRLDPGFEHDDLADGKAAPGRVTQVVPTRWVRRTEQRRYRDDGGWNGWSWWGWTLMSLTMLAFWGLVIWGVAALLRRPGDGRQEQQQPDSERILAERFARGEIDQDEYRQRLQTLRLVNGPSASLST